ncbi:MAG: esterase-like activity of phytase family protein [Bdellovibrionaceae bacterium]|nr:esterase-like activity of phytase family protein [Pseudobdellovibrionaceae bacterium]
MKFNLVAFLTFGLAVPLSIASQALDGLSMKPIQSVVIDTSKKFEGTKLGGFSGLSLQGQNLFVVTDDRGRFGPPRLYRYEIKTKTSKTEPFELKLAEKISLFKKTKKIPVYDLEGLASIGDSWLLSSEGDLNAKPKINPEVLIIKSQTVQQRIKLPSEFTPKYKGKQTAGLYNNKAFEGVYYDESNRRLYLVSESGLVQNKDGDQVFYILEYKHANGKFEFVKSSKMDFKELLGPNFVYNGISDLVKVADNSFIILSRSVQISLSLQYTNIAWLVKRKSENDSWEVKGKYLLNPDGDKEELNQNYEGLAVFDLAGTKYLIMVSDDNFNSFEKTVFSFFELEVK